MSEHKASPRLTRRTWMASSIGAVSLILSPAASATPERMQEAILAFTKGRPTTTARLRLDVPLLVENGNSVSLSVHAESPMKADDYVKTIAVFNERNPQPNVALFHFIPESGRAFAATRIRLGDTQLLVAIAETNDGRLWETRQEIVVTLPACVEN